MLYASFFFTVKMSMYIQLHELALSLLYNVGSVKSATMHITGVQRQ